jgi:hypothetical protein
MPLVDMLVYIIETMFLGVPVASECNTMNISEFWVPAPFALRAIWLLIDILLKLTASEFLAQFL